MKIWIDISNAPHVNFFEQLLSDWKAAGHDIEITARPLSNTVPLLDRCGVDYTVVGEHYGAYSISKLIGFPRRCLQLWRFLRHKSIDVAISQSSFYSPVVAKMLGCQSIYTNDNEFAKGNLTGFLFANLVLLPEPLRDWASKRFFRRRVRFYPGIKEGIYTYQLAGRLAGRRSGHSASRHRIVFRPEPWTAQYHKADKQLYRVLIEDLAKDHEVLVLPRGNEQSEFFGQIRANSIRVQQTPLSIEEIAAICDVFVGAGGSMSREFSYLGIPTISTYRGALLAVDRYLIDAGVMFHTTDLSPSAFRNALECLAETTVPESLRQDGKNAYQVIRESVNLL